MRLQPAARRDAIQGTVALAGGGVALRVAVTEAPEGGRANAALIRLLARTLREPKGCFALVSGGKQRNKKVHLSGDATMLGDKLETWFDGLERNGPARR